MVIQNGHEAEIGFDYLKKWFKLRKVLLICNHTDSRASFTIVPLAFGVRFALVEVYTNIMISKLTF
jgi:hypothetical protein